ncbi:hypothetical protein K438DRAFT_1023851 [Mycena galopus ATCC 62051]|nr:hypothetical protein K438DRAFT_1023851 [Mycena galopus ATCC 62051]
MLSVIVQSDSGENSSELGSSVHLPVERHDLSFAPPNRGHTEGPSRPLPERRLSFHRSHTSHNSHNDAIPPAIPPNRNPKITLPQLVVRQPTNRSSLAAPSPVAETPRRTRPPLSVHPAINQYFPFSFASESQCAPKPRCGTFKRNRPCHKEHCAIHGSFETTPVFFAFFARTYPSTIAS